nr:unnamed protein product [Callosobruchus chinensis]
MKLNIIILLLYQILLGFKIVDGLFVCSSCNKAYKHVTTVRSHLKYECNKDKQFQCTVCLKKFTRRCTLNVHLKMIHDQIPYVSSVNKS